MMAGSLLFPAVSQAWIANQVPLYRPVVESLGLWLSQPNLWKPCA
jgi:hypothetical protein